MLKLGKETRHLKKGNFEIIKENFVAHTNKTYVSPGLMIFRPAYNGSTRKVFVGNWTKNGFWISKFQWQTILFHPNVIARFIYHKGAPDRLEIRYSTGFSGLLSALFAGYLFTLYFMQFGQVYYFLSWIIWIAIYTGYAMYSLKRMKKAIQEKIFFGLQKINKHRIRTPKRNFHFQ